MFLDMCINEIDNNHKDPQVEEDALIIKVNLPEISAFVRRRKKNRAQQVEHNRIQEYEEEE